MRIESTLPQADFAVQQNNIKDVPVAAAVEQKANIEKPVEDLKNGKVRLDEAVAHANKAIEGSGRFFKYEIYEPMNQVVISVIDEKTKEVLKEIPSKKLLDVVTNLMDLAGLFIDERR